MKRIIQLEKDYWLIAEENMSETKANHTLIANSPGIREIKKSLDKKIRPYLPNLNVLVFS